MSINLSIYPLKLASQCREAWANAHSQQSLPGSVELHERMLATVDVLVKGRGCCRTARALESRLLRCVLIRVISGKLHPTAALKESMRRGICKFSPFRCTAGINVATCYGATGQDRDCSQKKRHD